ncbi:syntaxin-71-like [Solanum tuberosum]|uniref:syntaxin-71-like n=1 Tax=Solanum tuberosum TaxID=4113 RepID=UPI000739FE34|nr:PREDICTED: syntaxin-71-like [Solanum tuberosum]
MVQQLHPNNLVDGEVQIDKATSDLKNTNVRLKGTINQVKGLSSKEFVVCNDLVLAMPNRITAILDGAAATPKQSGGWGGSGSRFGGHIRKF